MSVEPTLQDPAAVGRAPAPEPVASLKLRAPPPRAVRLRRSAIQLMLAAAGVVLAGSLIWAFVAQPALREARRSQGLQTGLEESGSTPVRPSERVTAQPASYDRLPPPRIGGGDPELEPASAPSPTPSARPSWPAVRDGSPPPSSAAQQARTSGLFFSAAPSGPAFSIASGPPSPVEDHSSSPEVYNPHRLSGPVSPYELKAGALIPAVLLTAIDTSRAGPVVASVSQDVFDTVSGRHRLIPQGARLIGRHEGESAYGDRRAFLSWERLILPNGRSLSLASEPAVDAAGAVGVQGRADRRFLPLLAGTLLGGAITTLGQIARDDDEGGGLLGDAGDAAAIEGARVGGRLIDRELEVRPSIRLDAGVPIRAMITRDLVLEPYAP